MGKLKPLLGLVFASSFIVLLIVPLHVVLIDLILISILASGLIIYMRALNVTDWSDFKSFPTILLLLCMFRISMNVATTKKILEDGDAGQVINQFGEFVVGGNLLVGVVMFSILIILSFNITNSASRSAEVGARFTLDKVPGKQMSIDSDLQQRLITKEEAKEKRRRLEMETDYFGTLDGAGKFIKGDVIVSIAIVFVNIVFGLIIGVTQQGMSIGDAGYHYTILTVGDGIINQIAALLVATAAAVMVTRVYDDTDKPLPTTIWNEVMDTPYIPYGVGFFLIMVGSFTTLPFFMFLLVGVGLIILGYNHQKTLAEEKAEELKVAKEEMEQTEEKPKNDTMAVQRPDKQIMIYIGIALIPLVKGVGQSSLADKVELQRRTLANELGVRVSSIGLQENVNLPKDEYRIEVKGTVRGKGKLPTGRVFAMKTPYVTEELDNAEPGIEPIMGEEGYWIEEHMMEEATLYNYQVAEPVNMLTTHLSKIVRDNMHSLLQRKQVHELVNSLENENHHVLLEEIKEKNVSYALIQDVLRALLREGLSLKQLPDIIEGILDNHSKFQQVDDVVSAVRMQMQNEITEKYRHKNGIIYHLTMDAVFEENMNVGPKAMGGYDWTAGPREKEQFVQAVEACVKEQRNLGREVILITRRLDLRPALASLMYKMQKDISVVNKDEILAGTPSENVRTIGFVGKGEGA